MFGLFIFKVTEPSVVNLQGGKPVAIPSEKPVAVRKSLVQWLTESRFGISKFGIPIEIRSFGARGMSSVRYRTRLGDLKNKQSTDACGDRLYERPQSTGSKKG